MHFFTKVFDNILQSSLWSEDNETRLVWITMLAMADKDGYVNATAPGIARQAVIPDEATRKALEIFESPDPDSRTSEHEGRRIERVDGGYLILNYIKYRDIRSREHQREQSRESTRRYRERHAAEQGDIEAEEETEIFDEREISVDSIATDVKTRLGCAQARSTIKSHIQAAVLQGVLLKQIQEAVISADPGTAIWAILKPLKPKPVTPADDKTDKMFKRAAAQSKLEDAEQKKRPPPRRAPILKEGESVLDIAKRQQEKEKADG